jgi:nicotinamidase/pyrazinamidase
VLWPDHCVRAPEDAALLKGLTLPTAQLIIRKGYHQSTDSYSAAVKPTARLDRPRGLPPGTWRRHGLCLRPGHRFLCRLDRARRPQGELQGGSDRGACRGIDLNGSLKAAWDKMAKADVQRIQSGDIAV